MKAPVAIPRRPPLDERDVELATALGSSLTVRVWRERLPTVRVVRADRLVRGGWLDRKTWWDVRLEADDGWHAEGEIVDVEPLIDVDVVRGELEDASPRSAPRGRVRRIVRWLLWDELWLARHHLQTRLIEATWIEVE